MDHKLVPEDFLVGEGGTDGVDAGEDVGNDDMDFLSVQRKVETELLQMLKSVRVEHYAHNATPPIPLKLK